MILAEHKTKSRRVKKEDSLNSSSSKVKNSLRKVSRLILHSRNTQYAVINRIAKRLHWFPLAKEENDDDGSNGNNTIMDKRDQAEWSVMWIDSGLNIDKTVRTCKSFQRVNHFPGMVNIYRKSNLTRSMYRMQRIHYEAYDFFPRSWVLPMEHAEVLKYLNGAGSSPRGGGGGGNISNNNSRCVIIKPSGGAQGKGIYLAMSPKAVKPAEDAVAQIYIARPLLIDGYKFDLRIYALVTCCDPLRVLIYREGLVRLCTTPYSAPDLANAGNSFMHLTNYSLNKHNPNFVENNLEEEGDSSKRSLSWLWEWMRTQSMDPSEVWADISDVIVKTLISIQCTLAQSYRACQTTSELKTPFNCFELLGFDILLTDKLRATLIEVNHMPSYRTDSALDKFVKEGLIENTLRLLNVSVEEKDRCYARSAALSQMRLYGNLYSDSDNAKKKKLVKGADSRVRLWESYLKNERKFIGNFDLIYPANEDPSQPTYGMQPLYVELLTSSHALHWNQTIEESTPDGNGNGSGSLSPQERSSKPTSPRDVNLAREPFLKERHKLGINRSQSTDIGDIDGEAAVEVSLPTARGGILDGEKEHTSELSGTSAEIETDSTLSFEKQQQEDEEEDEDEDEEDGDEDEDEDEDDNLGVNNSDESGDADYEEEGKEDDNESENDEADQLLVTSSTYLVSSDSEDDTINRNTEADVDTDTNVLETSTSTSASGRSGVSALKSSVELNRSLDEDVYDAYGDPMVAAYLEFPQSQSKGSSPQRERDHKDYSVPSPPRHAAPSEAGSSPMSPHRFNRQQQMYAAISTPPSIGASPVHGSPNQAKLFPNMSPSHKDATQTQARAFSGSNSPGELRTLLADMRQSIDSEHSNGSSIGFDSSTSATTAVAAAASSILPRVSSIGGVSESIMGLKADINSTRSNIESTHSVHSAHSNSRSPLRATGTSGNTDLLPQVQVQVDACSPVRAPHHVTKLNAWADPGSAPASPIETGTSAAMKSGTSTSTFNNPFDEMHLATQRTNIRVGESMTAVHAHAQSPYLGGGAASSGANPLLNPSSSTSRFSDMPAAPLLPTLDSGSTVNEGKLEQLRQQYAAYRKQWMQSYKGFGNQGSVGF